MPVDQTKLRSFLVLALYYHRFVHNFAQLAASMQALTEKGKLWQRSKPCSEAFLELKKQLVSAPILMIPQFNHEFLLDTDASGQGLGAVLSQRCNDCEHIVAYAIKTVTKSECLNCETRCDMLALVWAIRHFHPYLYR